LIQSHSSFIFINKQIPLRFYFIFAFKFKIIFYYQQQCITPINQIHRITILLISMSLLKNSFRKALISTLIFLFIKLAPTNSKNKSLSLKSNPSTPISLPSPKIASEISLKHLIKPHLSQSKSKKPSNCTFFLTQSQKPYLTHPQRIRNQKRPHLQTQKSRIRNRPAICHSLKSHQRKTQS
jgi:hypothetical protein